jgi:hypothetical protein
VGATGCYDLLLTCDVRSCRNAWESHGSEQTYRQAERAARAAGWTVGSVIRLWICPACTRAEKDKWEADEEQYRREQEAISAAEAGGLE